MQRQHTAMMKGKKQKKIWRTIIPLMASLTVNLSFGAWLVYQYDPTAVVQTESRRLAMDPIYPTSSAGAVDLPSPLNGYRKHIIKTYQQLVDEQVLPYQTESWNYILGYKSVDESEMGSCPRVYNNDPKQALSLESPSSIASAMTTRERSLQQMVPSPNDLDWILWDDEDNIRGYLKTLFRGCSQKVTEDTDFGRDCWGYMKDLIYEPLCTLRMDSRTTCRGKETPVTASSVEEVILNQDHFSQESLNVVIVGAGPVGLFLANALARADREKARRTTWQPPIRITVFDNRVDHPGVKRPYTRNWQTVPELEDFYNIVDDNVRKIFETVSDEGKFGLPLNAIETLLYLSCRDRGVKFIFDANYEQYIPMLEQKASNLMVFDTTGHRMDSLVRGNNCHTTDTEETVQKWRPDKNYPWEWFDRHTYKNLLRYDNVVDIAQKGELLYPIDRHRGGIPYATWWVHVNMMPRNRNFYRLDDFWDALPSNTTSKLCMACHDQEENDLSDEECYKFCKQNRFFTSMEYYRDDIRRFILKDQDSPNRTTWFAKRGANINLSSEQAKAIQGILHDHGYGADPVGMPLADFPLKSMSESKVFQENNLIQALTRMQVRATPDQPTITLFQHRPYAYKKVLKKKGGLFRNENTPVLRMGDSLMTGDPNLGSGLITHLWVLRVLICRIRGEDDECNLE